MQFTLSLLELFSRTMVNLATLCALTVESSEAANLTLLRRKSVSVVLICMHAPLQSRNDNPSALVNGCT